MGEPGVDHELCNRTRKSRRQDVDGMGIRFALSNLTRADARQSAARWLLLLCAFGYGLTLSVLFARGGGLRDWLFALFAWGLFVYLPLRILLEAFQSIAPRIRRSLVAQTLGQPRRYAMRPSVELLVDRMLDREVVMPRIATPLQRMKAHDGAVAVLLRLGREDLASHRGATIRCLAVIDRWVAELGADTSGPIQARWASLRALAALAALTRILLAAYHDRAGAPLTVPNLQDRSLEAYLDACLDYCDELALKVDALPWTEPPLELPPQAATSEVVRGAWSTFAQTEPPAVEARDAFLTALVPPA